MIWLTPEGIMEYLETAPIPKLTQKKKKNWASPGLRSIDDGGRLPVAGKSRR